MQRTRRFTLGRLLLAAVLAAVFSGLAWVSWQAGNYLEHLDAYSGHIARQDQTAARNGLKDLEYFYELNKKLDAVYLGWVGEKHLFHDLAQYQAAFFYVTGDFEKVVSELRDDEGFWPAYLRGNARWRQAQGIYRNGLSLTDKKEQARQLQIADELAGTLAKDDYAEAVKANPNHAESSWNYDMTSDPQARQRGLQPKPGAIKVRLGESVGGSRNPGPQGDDSKGEGKKPKDLDTNEEGPGRPDGKPRKSG